MKRAALAIALAALFYVANRGAYQGYFSGDDLDSLAWTTITGWDIYYEGIASPKVSPDNFRPVGHLIYRVLGKTAGLRFPVWVAAIQLLHLGNCVLLWLVLRRLCQPEWPALAATLFYSFHPALFDAFWKPMFLFDVSCGAFCMASLLLYLHGRTGLAVAAFWMAMKSKEIAILLPAVLAAYEFLLGERRWRRLIPFFAVSVLFGGQALWNNAGQKGPYRMSVTVGGLLSGAGFYSRQIFCSSWTCAALAVLFVPAIATRDRRVPFGFACALLLLAPMLLFPGRALAVYWYVPLIGVTVALAAAASNFHRLSVFAVLAIWLVFSYADLREYRKKELTDSAAVKAYVDRAFATMRNRAEWTAFRYDGSPPTLESWGVLATWRHAAGREFPGEHFLLEDGWRQPPSSKVPIFTWDHPLRKLTVSVHEPSRHPASFVDMKEPWAVFQLGRGWHGVGQGARRLGARSTATLGPDPAASLLALSWRVDGIQRAGKLDLVVAFDGAEFGRFPCERDGAFATTWPVAKPFQKAVEISFHVETPTSPENLPAPEQLVWIGSFGFRKADGVTIDRNGPPGGELARVAR